MASKPVTAPSDPVTVLDVAREAGVSASTVSRILNGTARVAASKRTAVEEAIRRLEFRPNLSARSLRQGRTMTIGILTQDVESPFYGRSMSGIEAGLAGSGYAPLMVSGHWNATEEAERIRILMARRIDGIVVLTGHLDEAQIIDFARRQPVVVTGRRIAGPNVRAIKLDQSAGGYLVTRHLLDSLAIVPYVRGDSLVDLGTGAGLPGIPLALLDEQRAVTLVDSNGKKIRFLREAVRVLGLRQGASRRDQQRRGQKQSSTEQALWHAHDGHPLTRDRVPVSFVCRGFAHGRPV